MYSLPLCRISTNFATLILFWKNYDSTNVPVMFHFNAALLIGAAYRQSKSFLFIRELYTRQIIFTAFG
jgi:hypothetical protein